MNFTFSYLDLLKHIIVENEILQRRNRRRKT